ncbi:hypothetical protein tinsulaeT_20200 [Thalassotalea insulae]|uniref:EF-hand domain-containing protein n=1 Tax=Thalassotalea insulae TaxID=2056778 RepID=A0ABQ6GVG0_9GAMM|nr:EF-hand domain-containing protein [Thalassotalea insulae]GLX78680.1 hypothetical protein tinsulaeT_20200 [Thalassotalea insulae]
MSTFIKSAVFAAFAFSGINSVLAHQVADEREVHPPRPCFSTIDANSDGKITFKEFAVKKLPRGKHKAVFSRIDTDNNGVISRHEFTNHKPPQPPHHQGADHD